MGRYIKFTKDHRVVTWDHIGGKYSGIKHKRRDGTRGYKMTQEG